MNGEALKLVSVLSHILPRRNIKFEMQKTFVKIKYINIQKSLREKPERPFFTILHKVVRKNMNVYMWNRMFL